MEGPRHFQNVDDLVHCLGKKIMAHGVPESQFWTLPGREAPWTFKDVDDLVQSLLKSIMVHDVPKSQSWTPWKGCP